MNFLHRLLILAPVLLLASGVQAEQPKFPEAPIPEPPINNKPIIDSKSKAAKPKPIQTKPATASILTSKGYLGMGINKLPAAIRAQMPDAVANTQGLLVTQFTNDSPAADDGIKLYDILINYDKQLIDQPEKLIEMIRDDKPGRVIQFKLIRQGKVLTVPVTLGEQKVTQEIINLHNKPKPVVNSAARRPPIYPPVRQTAYPYKGMPAGYPRRYPAQWGYPNQQLPMMPPQGYPTNPYQANRPFLPNGRPNQYPPAYPNTQPTYPARPGMRYPAPQPLAYQNPKTRVATPAYPMQKKFKKEKHAWGEKRNIWQDFYTDFTGDMWDDMMNAPFDVGRMPGGWRAPSLSTPDPVTIGDAVTNQIPPMVEEMGNMTDFSN